MMIKKIRAPLLLLLFFPWHLAADPVRVTVVGSLDISSEKTAESSLALGYASSALVMLDRETRFFRGIELELAIPAAFLAHQRSLAIVLYGDLDKVPGVGVADIEGRQIALAGLPGKIQIIYQIPLTSSHGLRNSPYASVLTGIVPPSSFPLLVRIMPVDKGLAGDIEKMIINLTARPIFSDEGAVKINCRYPPLLAGKPFTVLVDDEIIERPMDERLLKEGEHHLMVLSEDYRNESRRFMVERGKVLDILVELQDPTPLIIFEAPENAQVYLDNQLLGPNPGPVTVEPGNHEIRFQVGDYSVIRPLIAQKGKTYRAALTVDVTISDEE
ncbi:hypothetical protein AGMMS49928_10890 [Spirochaetia bacterium]|nr:hypothetical protein AGMMS49928_10890 [Spirochaetia bacterium]